MRKAVTAGSVRTGHGGRQKAQLSTLYALSAVFDFGIRGGANTARCRLGWARCVGMFSNLGSCGGDFVRRCPLEPFTQRPLDEPREIVPLVFHTDRLERCWP